LGDRLFPRLASIDSAYTDTIQDKLVQQGGIAPDRISVISNGIEFEHFDPCPRRHQTSRSRQNPDLHWQPRRYQGIDLMLRLFGTSLQASQRRAS
jgi:hypothetical protein